MNLAMSEHAVPLYEAVKAFIKNEIDPITEEYFRLGENRADHWGYGEGQQELMDSVKAKAKANGLWNFSCQMLRQAKVSPISTTHILLMSWDVIPSPRNVLIAVLQTRATWRFLSESEHQNKKAMA